MAKKNELKAGDIVQIWFFRFLSYNFVSSHFSTYHLLRLIVGTVLLFFFFLGILPSNFSFECGIFILKLQNLRYDTKYSCNSLLIII